MQTLIYFLISLIGASLLFIVQPMAAKSALPILGGAPFVWNGCMLFFQALLLGGYLYAHLLNKALPVKHQPLVHLPFLAVALFAFPITFQGSTYFNASLEPMGWLLSMLTLSVGLPFFVLCATSPLSQRWFAAAVPTRQPYALYAASNAGSFGGLMAYPTIVEPLLSIRSQATLLFYGFCLLLTLFAVAGFLRMRAPHVESKTTINTTITHITTHFRALQWILLSFVPSSLLYGVTAYVTTDIASVPLFWVVPLALYLLTFVLIFGSRAPRLDLWRTAHRMGTPVVAFLALLPLSYPTPVMLLHLIVFFAATMTCHSRLSELKPAPEQLTGFFLWVSFGGVLGGIFNTLIAPIIFTTVIEYPLMLVISLAVAGTAAHAPRPTLRVAANLTLVWGLFATLFWALGSQIAWFEKVIGDPKSSQPILLACLTLSGLALLMLIYFRKKNQPLIHAAWVAPILMITIPLFNLLIGNHEAFIGRNVFGVSRVVFQPEKNAWFLRHGTTYHGMQSANEIHRLKPTSYYGPLIDVYNSLPKELAHAPVAVMGMGVGTVACYGQPKQKYDFFEIDPLVNKIARDTRYFTYLRDCAPDINIVIGDGRISLAHSRDNYYGLIIIDVFSSDAIPMHVLTREAVAMYATKLREGGYIAFNVSNRHINLVPVLGAIAKDINFAVAWKLTANRPLGELQLPSEWVVLTKALKELEPLATLDNGWNKLLNTDPKYLWRDDYSNILRSMNF
jgi:hypothetical protein